jgi:hypothetical protein
MYAKYTTSTKVMRDRAMVTRRGPTAFMATFEQQKPKEKRQATQRWRRETQRDRGERDVEVRGPSGGP